METGYSLSDISAVTGGMNGFGGNNFFVTMILFFALISGGLGWGNRGDYGQFATSASQQEILFGQQFQNLDNKMDRLGNGIADARRGAGLRHVGRPFGRAGIEGAL